VQQPRSQARKPPNRIDEHGVRQVAPTWESLVDRQIREAMEDGRFDELPFRGEPLPADDDAFAGEWAMAFRMLKNAGIAPPWIEADKEVRGLLARRDALLARASTASPFARRRDRAELEQLVIDINAAVARLNAEAPTYQQHRRPLRLEAELGRYDAAARP
jgi:DnaJ family protein C protein 28